MPWQGGEYNKSPGSNRNIYKHRVPWSHIHIVQTLRMLEANIDNKDDNEPKTHK